MSYSEENGQVVLTMSREDYDLLRDAALRWDLGLGEDLWNRLNQGNPHYTPYQVGEKDGR